MSCCLKVDAAYTLLFTCVTAPITLLKEHNKKESGNRGRSKAGFTCTIIPCRHIAATPSSHSHTTTLCICMAAMEGRGFWPLGYQKDGLAPP
jgi:hypothetical protein